MGFTVRFLLGTVLVLSCAWCIQTTQIHEEKKDEQVEATTQSVVVANLSEESNNEPKTDVSTENNKTVDSSSETSRIDVIGRLLDIEKYVSKDFHNNEYTFSTSPGTQQYINPEYDFQATTHRQREHSAEFDFDAELTTPKSLIFDQKYKEAVESLDEKLEHIDDSHELSSEFESKEHVNVEKLYERTKKNDTTADLNYVNYKNIIANDTGGKNSLHKDVVVEAGSNLAFQSSYNHTTIIDENDSGNNTIIKEPESEEKVDSSTISNIIPVKGDLEKTESVTLKTPPLTTRKSIVLTKPPSTRNSSHISILSNNIETETVKAIHPIPTTTTTTTTTTTEKSKGELEGATEASTKRTLTDVTKRGSIKFSDTLTTQPTVPENKIAKKPELLLQENQIIPVHVVPSLNYSVDTTTVKIEAVTSTTVKIETTPTPVATTTTTTTTTTRTTTEMKVVTTTEAEPEITTTSLPNEATTQTQTQIESTSTQSETPIVTVRNEITTGAPQPETTTYETTTDMTSTIPTATETEATTYMSTFLADSTVTTTADATTTDDISSTTEQVPTTVIISTDEVNNTSFTTESVRTSKKMMYRESTTTTEPVVTVTPEPQTATPEVAETVRATVEQETTAFVFPVSAPVPEVKHALQNDSTAETETTENNTITSDSYELTTNSPDDNSGTIAAITISSIGAVCLVLLVGLLVIMRKRQKRFNYGQRCRPVSLDDYSLDNVSVYNNSVRRKGMARGSKRSYGNPAFEDPASVSHTLNFPALGKFASNLDDMRAEFEEIPQITARTNELPEGCDTKNRYANVIPLPETRVFLGVIDGYPNSDYINANYVTGPKNTKGYYIACQAPLLNTVDDFWRMVWEQQSKVVLMLTHLFENGVEKCVDYLPPSEVLDCHRLFGDFQVTLKKREVKDKYIISIVQLKNMVSNSWREVTHFWYLGWPEKGVPLEANSLIAFLIEARSYMKSSSLDRKEVTNGNLSNGGTKNEVNPVVVHCSPGTGRTGVVIACDIAIREFEQTRLVDIPRIVYKIRRDRASAVQTKEQYVFIYKVVNLYATKLAGGALDTL